ncbi:MAG: hypothetical protein U0793_00900 [Gemmataceae bacterium]
MASLLAEVRARLGPTPRPFGPGKRSYNRVSMPPGFPKEDPLFEVFLKQELLMREGKVAWGAIVQANSLLYQPGGDDSPAVAIYCEHADVDERPELLTETAQALFQLRKQPGKEWDERQYGLMLKNERDRFMGIKVPAALARGYPMMSASIMVFREHLPTRFLCGTLVPVLTHYTTAAVLIVPHPYWPDALVSQWLDASQSVLERFPDAEYIALTPRAVDAIFNMAEREQLAEPWYVRILVRPGYRGEPASYSLELDRRYEPDYDRLLRHDELDILVDRRDMDWLDHLLVDCQKGQGGGIRFTFAGQG